MLRRGIVADLLHSPRTRRRCAMSTPATLLFDYLTMDQLATELDIAVITLKRWAAFEARSTGH